MFFNSSGVYFYTSILSCSSGFSITQAVNIFWRLTVCTNAEEVMYFLPPIRCRLAKSLSIFIKYYFVWLYSFWLSNEFNWYLTLVRKDWSSQKVRAWGSTPRLTFLKEYYKILWLFLSNSFAKERVRLKSVGFEESRNPEAGKLLPTQQRLILKTFILDSAKNIIPNLPKHGEVRGGELQGGRWEDRCVLVESCVGIRAMGMVQKAKSCHCSHRRDQWHLFWDENWQTFLGKGWVSLGSHRALGTFLHWSQLLWCFLNHAV